MNEFLFNTCSPGFRYWILVAIVYIICFFLCAEACLMYVRSRVYDDYMSALNKYI